MEIQSEENAYEEEWGPWNRDVRKDEDCKTPAGSSHMEATSKLGQSYFGERK